MKIFRLATAGALCLAAATASLADEAVAPAEQNSRLHSLVREHAAGMGFSSIESTEGKTFQEVVIVSASPSEVVFRHAGGDGVLSAAECPALWVELFGLASEAGTTNAAASRQPDRDVAEAIVVIEGDRSTGTGFFCRDGGETYLYSAAHVLSGNTRLKVKLRDGTVVRKFGALEAAEGADLVRLPVEEKVSRALEIAPASGVATVGMPVFASGNAGGGGTVGYEVGKVKGVGPESVEIDAEVIQGNSGGPILHGSTHHVVGVVTHLTAARKDHWAKETRYADVRRFGCRLDREWEWKTVPVDVFLKEGKAILAVQEQSELMIAALQPAMWDDEIFHRLRDNPLARDISALNTWILEQRQGGQRFSESDRKKRLRGIFASGRHRSRAQMEALNSESFTWFHRETAAQEIRSREEIDKAYDTTTGDLR